MNREQRQKAEERFIELLEHGDNATTAMVKLEAEWYLAYGTPLSNMETEEACRVKACRWKKRLYERAAVTGFSRQH